MGTQEGRHFILEALEQRALLSGDAQIELIGQLGGAIGDVERAGDLLYVSEGASLTVVDITDRMSPRRRGSLPLPGWAHGVKLRGNLAYVAADFGGLCIVDISNPDAPKLHGYYDTPGRAFDVDLAGDRACVADSNGGLQLLNVSNPAEPVLLGWFATPYATIQVICDGDLAYVVEELGTVHITQVNNIPVPMEISRIHGGETNFITKVGNLVYAPTSKSLRIYDVTDPAAPQQLYESDANGWNQSIVVSDGIAFVAKNPSGGVIRWDVHDPTAPVKLASFQVPGLSSMSLVGELLVTHGLAGGAFTLFDITDPMAPQQLGTYRSLPNTFGLDLADGLAYTASGSLGIVDIHDPRNPRLLSTCPVAHAETVGVGGGYAYLSRSIERGEGIAIVDVSDPLNPVSCSMFTDVARASDIHVKDGWAYAIGPMSSYMLDISDPVAPVLQSTVLASGWGTTAAFQGDLAYIGGSGLVIWDVHDPANPVRLGTLTFPTEPAVMAVAVRGSFAYLANYTGGLRVVDVSNPAAPVELAQYQTHGPAVGITMVGELVCVVDYSGLTLVDVSDPAHPRQRGFHRLSGIVSQMYDMPDQLMAVGNLVYVAGHLSGFQIFRITLPGDADRDGRVDADDYFRIDLAFLSRGDADAENDLGGFDYGDFNDDGRIDIDDYFLIDCEYAGQSAREGVLDMGEEAVFG